MSVVGNVMVDGRICPGGSFEGRNGVACVTVWSGDGWTASGGDPLSRGLVVVNGAVARDLVSFGPIMSGCGCLNGALGPAYVSVADGDLARAGGCPEKVGGSSVNYTVCRDVVVDIRYMTTLGGTIGADVLVIAPVTVADGLYSHAGG